MKIFKYKFSKLTKSLIYAGIALCVVGFGVNIYSLIVSDIASAANPFYPILQHALMFLVPAFCLCFDKPSYFVVLFYRRQDS